ncbi:MAG: lysophospholipid acyltransferase family protein [candidate division WOR-3 bacterium]
MKWRFLFGLLFVYPIAKILLRLKVLGREHLPRGGVIIVANHTSNFDPPLLVLAARREMYFLAKEELFRVSKFFSWLIRSFNALPLSRGRFSKGLLLKIKELTEKGKAILIFPEGTRSRNGKMGDFKPGVGFIAKFIKVPVIPCLVRGVKDSIIPMIVDRDLVREGLRNSYALPKIEVRFGKPLSPEEDIKNFAFNLRKRLEEMADEGFGG